MQPSIPANHTAVSHATAAHKQKTDGKEARGFRPPAKRTHIEYLTPSIYLGGSNLFRPRAKRPLFIKPRYSHDRRQLDAFKVTSHPSTNHVHEGAQDYPAAHAAVAAAGAAAPGEKRPHVVQEIDVRVALPVHEEGGVVGLAAGVKSPRGTGSCCFCCCCFCCCCCCIVIVL